MAEESETPDRVELVRRAFDAMSSGDLDEAMGLFAPDAVWEARGLGTTFEGSVAIRDFMETWQNGYEAFESRLVEFRDLGRGVGFVSYEMGGRLVGSSGSLQERWSYAAAWSPRGIERIVVSPDPGEALAAAERLAQERADG